MNKYKGRTETSKNGFIPTILDLDEQYVAGAVLDNSYVEYGTGCWVDKGSDPEVSFEAQLMVYNMFHGGLPDNHYIFNTCNDYRVCYNPNCLSTMEVPEYNESD